MRNRVRLLVLAVAVVTALTHLSLQPATGQTQYTNPTPITIPALGPTVPAPWPGSPYPSNIAISGLTGTVTDVNVILSGFDCSAGGPDFAYPEDNDVLLVGPDGTNLVPLSDIGGDNSPPARRFTDITLTLDDEAADPLPADAQLASGTYRPLDDDDDPDEQLPTDTFPAPAPMPSTATALSAFDGTDPNGTWSLYLADDWRSPNTCSVLRGWTLEIATSAEPTTTTTSTTSTSTTSTTTTTMPTTTTTTTTVPPAPLLVVGITDDPDPVGSAGTVAYAVTVENRGTAAASDVTLVNTLRTSASGARFLWMSANSGSCAESKGATKGVSCDLGSIGAGQSAVVTLGVRAQRHPGTMTLVAEVVSSTARDFEDTRVT